MGTPDEYHPRRQTDDAVLDLVREVGELTGTVRSLVQRIDPLVIKVDAHEASLNEQKGSLRAFKWIGGIGGISGIGSAIVHFFTNGPTIHGP